MILYAIIFGTGVICGAIACAVVLPRVLEGMHPAEPADDDVEGSPGTNAHQNEAAK